MRIPLAAGLIAGLVVLVARREVPAQWTSNKVRAHGMFGERELGETLKLKPSSRFGNSFWRGPSGNFLGRDATLPGMRFPSPHRELESIAGGFRVGPPPVQAAGVRPLLPEEVPAAAQVQEQPVLQEAPQIWFRGNSPPGGAAAVPPRAVLPAGAGPGIALGGGGLGGVAAGPVGRPPRPAIGVAIGFPQAGSVDQVLSSVLSTQIAKIPRFQLGEPIKVSVSAGIATLQGTVPTPHDRKVLAEFVRMEPGVWDVDNRLTVKPPAEAATVGPK